MIHIWHEDSKNSTTNQFWNFFKANYVSKSLANADIQAFNGNQRLCNYLEVVEFNIQDKYYIFIDKVTDNHLALQYYKKAKKITKKHPNVKLINLLSFEYLLLKFKYFVEWTRPVAYIQLYDECIQVRKEMIHCIETNQSWINNDIIVNFIIKRKQININNQNWQRELCFISSEKVVTTIINAMTNGGTTEFGVSKTNLGRCWHQDCCYKYKNSKVGNKKCRMYRYKKTSRDKAKNLWNNTDARKIILES